MLEHYWRQTTTCTPSRLT